MATLRPDPTFFPSPRSAMQAPPEDLPYVIHALVAKACGAPLSTV
jgi:hypothetical protein